MANLEKMKRKNKKPNDKSRLFEEVMKSKPLYSSKGEALKDLTFKLKTLASKNGLSVEALLERAESDSKFDEDHLDALMIARQIAYFRK